MSLEIDKQWGFFFFSSGFILEIPFIYLIFVSFLWYVWTMKNISWHPFNKTHSKKIYFLTTVSLSDNGKLHKTFLGQIRQLRNFDFDHGWGNLLWRWLEAHRGSWSQLGTVIDFRCSLNNTEDKCPRGRLLEGFLAVSNTIFLKIPRFLFFYRCI